VPNADGEFAQLYCAVQLHKCNYYKLVHMHTYVLLIIKTM